MTTGLGNSATTAASRATHARARPRPSSPAAIARAAATIFAATTLGVGVVGACVGSGDASRGGEARGERGAFTLETTRRATVAGFAADTLSDAARILALYPGSGVDSAVIAFTFADSTRGVSAGLGVLDLRADDGGRVAHLAWPDSVRAVRWAATAPHVLAFTTTMGRHVTVQLDVAADTLGILVDTGPAAHMVPAPRQSSSGVGKAAVDRAIAFVDSTHQQPAGRAAPRAALRYAVDAMLGAPDGRLAAFHVTASDSGGRRLNPAWYILARSNGAVASVDSVVGPASELPASVGAWGGEKGTTFYYARGAGVYEVRVRE